MPYTREKGREFWYDLDNQALFQRTPEMTAAMGKAYFEHGLTFDSVFDALETSFGQADHPASFIATVEVGNEGFLELATLQNNIMETHLEDDAGIQCGFEDIGQGVLFDDRAPRPTTRHVHMMDGTPDNWVGYHRWHAFARAAILLGADANRWLHINRCIALAWAIQTEANPTIDAQDNPGLPSDRLDTLRATWINADADKLDQAFTSNRFRAPAPGGPGDGPATTGYARVQSLLGGAAGNSSPFHGGHAKFWELSFAEFMALPPIYDVPLIADAGPDRGARSGLVKVLKGEQTDIPQMPLNRPAMSAEDIQFIETWIDDGCPEF